MNRTCAHFCIHTLAQTPLYLKTVNPSFYPHQVANLVLRSPPFFPTLVTSPVLAPPSRHSQAKRSGCQSKHTVCTQTLVHLAWSSQNELHTCAATISAFFMFATINQFNSFSIKTNHALFPRTLNLSILSLHQSKSLDTTQAHVAKRYWTFLNWCTNRFILIAYFRGNFCTDRKLLQFIFDKCLKKTRQNQFWKTSIHVKTNQMTEVCSSVYFVFFMTC